MDYKNISSRAEIIALITNLEKKYPIEQWEAYGICIWPIVRFSIYAKLWNKLCKDNKDIQNYKKVRYSKIIKELLCEFISTPKNNPFAIFLNNTGCRRCVDGIWIDVFTDPIRNMLSARGYSSAVYEWSNTKYTSQNYSDSVHFQSNLNWIKIKAKVKAKLKKEHLFVYFNEVNSCIGNILNIQELSYQIELIHELYLFFRKNLRKIAPKIAFSTIYYNEVSMAFFLACKEEGIITIDIQHGMQVGNNPAYSYGKNLPANAYTLLPDIFLVRSIAEKNNLEAWLKQGKVIISGDIWLNFWQKENEEIIKKYDQLIQAYKNNAKRLILYTLDYEPIPDFMKKVIKKTSDEYFWCIRLHPADMDNLPVRRQELMSLDVEFDIENSSNWPLHAWLRNVDIHITEYSGVVYEAEQFGIPSIIVSKNEWSIFKDIIDRKNAVAAKSEAEIIQYMKGLKKWQYSIQEKASFIDEIINVLGDTPLSIR